MSAGLTRGQKKDSDIKPNYRWSGCSYDIIYAVIVIIIKTKNYYLAVNPLYLRHNNKKNFIIHNRLTTIHGSNTIKNSIR